METPEVRYAFRDDRAIAYQSWGAGTLESVVITEWPGNSDAVWEHPGHTRTWRFLGSLTQAVRFDRSGIGSSDPPVGDLGDVDAWADDGMAVLDAVGYGRVVVAGEGWGAQVAASIAVRYPERVDRLVLLNGFARMTQTDDYPHGLPPDRVDRAVEGLRSRWGTGSVIGGLTPNLGREYADFCARYERLAASPGVAAATTRAMFGCDARALLPRISCPTLVLYNGDYRHIDPGHSRYLAEHITDAELLEVRSETFVDLSGGVGRRYAEFVTGEVAGSWTGRQLAVVVFSDIVDSTAQLARHGDREWTSILDDYHEAVGREVTRFAGRVVKQTGDGHLMTFPSPGAAISAVFGMRRVAHALGLSIRLGMHIGEIETRLDGDIAGIAVHTAARIAARAGTDEVLVSSTIRELLAGTGLHFRDSGEHDLKGLPAPVRLFSVTPEQPDQTRV